MADVIRKATNRFTKGLVMDFSPENTKNEVLTQALNATLLTFNGNELSLQNDMGNARVETAYLPEGYMPVGTCEYGGIVYIVSYNPIENKSQIGCFPSPERNLSNKELGISDAKIYRSKFQKFNQSKPTGDIINTTQYVMLKNDNLNPGDKFLICANKEIYNERLADLWIDKDDKHYSNQENNPQDFELVSNPIIALNVVSIEESGKIVYLNSDIKHYKSTTTYSKEVNGVSEEFTDVYKYHILGEMPKNGDTYEQAAVDIDSYRDVLNSGYSIFKSKTSGKLAILAELITIDSYSVTHSIVPKTTIIDNKEVVIEGSFDVVIHTNISPEITYDNYYLAPKLQYYHLANSQGYLQIEKNNTQTAELLFKMDSEGVWQKNNDFLNTTLDKIYTPITDDIDLSKTISTTGQFNFPVPDTYHGRMQSYTGDLPGVVDNKVYTKFTEGKYHRLKKNQVIDNKEYFTDKLNAKFYRYSVNTGYKELLKTETLNTSYTYYVKTTAYAYYDAKRDYTYKQNNVPLYKLASEPIAATEDIIEDVLIEKFQQIEIHSYKEATSAELEDGTTLYTKDGNKYTSHTGPTEPGVTYYVLNIEYAFVSIGYDINMNDYTGQIFYYPTTKDYVEALEKDLEIYWDFDRYELTSESPWGCPEILYWRKEIESYRPATDKELLEFQTSELQLFYRTDYVYISDIGAHSDSDGQLFITVPIDTYVSCERFIPNASDNYILGYDKPYHKDEPNTGFPDEGPISLFTVADFIPNNLKDDSTSLQYKDITLASIKIPREVSVNGLDLPFKYDYTLVPCMNFGKLQHLAISNTVDFSKLHAFNQSDFTTWKYYIEDSQLRLTFGVDVYDTYETDKVDGLVLEFYDLWGFAGSIEITDKKSYSGVFTKIIPLNSLNAISRNRVIGSIYSDAFNRNVNIVEKPATEDGEGHTFTFNGKEVKYKGYSSGWRYELTNETTNKNDSLGDDNDCGTLYSNLVYGVKTYLRVTKNKGTNTEEYKFIPKKEFFLYTLPIFNDYYYTVSDFSSLEKPQLDMMLTYKLQDKSSKEPYYNENITNGFYNVDNELMGQYLSGFLQGVSTINTVKYYKYSGASDLNLEIGLKKEYQEFNVSYSPDINNYFTCNLKLLADDSENTYSVLTSNSISNDIATNLNYYHQNNIPIPTTVNKFGFGPNMTQTEKIDKDFVYYNFIHNTGNKTIPINYEFVVGYKVDIDNIKTTEIQATTICALLHKDPTGNYNYDDFGIYEQLNNNGEIQYLSNAMFYNAGTSEKEVFGLCKQITTEAGKTMIEQCSSFTSIETDAQEIKTPGKLNSGEPLKQLVGNIGKLTFCQPHAHGLGESYGVNIHGELPSRNYYGIPPEEGGWELHDNWADGANRHDDSYGIMPLDYINTNPIYNLSLNTKNSINYNSEFISTVDWSLLEDKEIKSISSSYGHVRWHEVDNMREFVGMTGLQISEFNKKLLNTMSKIYAYNPDYDSLAVNVGDVSIQNQQIKITSNLLSTNSHISCDNINDFIYLGPIKFSDYINYLHKYSEDHIGTKLKITTFIDNEEKLLGQLQLTPGLTYCGTEENPYLISSLTYNMPIPHELESELSFKASDSLLIKHSDGNIEFLNGIPDKKTLYGFNTDLHKLIQLDVSNYTIDSDGNLTLNSNSFTSEKQEFTESPTEDMMNSAFSETYTVTKTFTGIDDTSEVPITMEFRLLGAEIIQSSENSVIIATRRTEDKVSSGFYFDFTISTNILNQKGYTYYVTNPSISLSCNAVILDNDELNSLINVNRVYIDKQNYDTLHTIISMENSVVPVITSDGNSTSVDLESLYTSREFQITYNGKVGEKLNNIVCKESFTIEVYPIDGETANRNDLELYELFFDSIDFTVNRNSSLKDMSSSVVRVSPTRIYFERVNDSYSVISNYNNTRIRGTSLTLNDLMYEPSQNGHRLFIKNNLCVYNNKYRGKLYYRTLDYDDETDKTNSSWNYSNTKNLNCLFLYTGPCFTPDYL